MGILPLPVLMGMAGVGPSWAVFAGCTLYMSVTALLILEACWAGGGSNYLSLARGTLNRAGQGVTFGAFVFLFYALMTAYLAKGGEITEALTGLPKGMGGAVLAMMSTGAILVGTLWVDYLNRLFMVGLAGTYAYLMLTGAGHFQGGYWERGDWSEALWTVPFAITSFGYHNMVPSVNEYLGPDRRRQVLAVAISGGVLLAVYGMWVMGLLGVIPLELLQESLGRGEIVTEPLARVIGSPVVRGCATYMAFFAIVTSVLGQGMSVVDFLADAGGVGKGRLVRLALCGALFGPAYLCSQAFPGVFFKALEFAGGVAAMAVFGLVPALMSWVVRYRRGGQAVVLVPGGKPVLVVVMAVAVGLIAYEVVKNLI